MTTPAVLSVEKFSISMPDATVSTPALSLGQDIDNCVPFMTISSNNSVNKAQMVDVSKNTGTDKFDFVCSSVGARTLEVTIVEFDPAEVTVQEVSFTVGSGLSVDVTVTAIVEANTFPIIYASEAAETTERYGRSLMLATFTSTTKLHIEKHLHGVDLVGHAYILEADNGAWAIETGASISTSYVWNSAAENEAITVTANRTGLWIYHDAESLGNTLRDSVWDGVITNNTNLDLTRGNGATPAGNTTEVIESFVVEFAADVAIVQQGEFNYITSATKTAAISAPGELDNTMIVGTRQGSYCEGSSAVSPKATSQGRMTFNSSTEVLGTRSGTGDGNYRQNFQVIEWLIADIVNPIIIHIGV